MRKLPEDYVTRNDFEGLSKKVDILEFNMNKKFTSLEEMVAESAETLTSLTIFMRDHVRQQDLLHVRIDQRLDRLEEGSY